MNFIFGYAGIPAVIFDRIFADRLNIAGGNAEFVAQPLPDRGVLFRYSESHANFFLRKFSDRLEADQSKNALADTAFGIFYVSHDPQSTATFVQRFFPSVFVVPVTWIFDGSNEMTIRHSKNNLQELLRAASNEAKKALTVLKREVGNKPSKTPFLLPVRNFISEILVQELKDLNEQLVSSKDKEQAIKDHTDEFGRRHPRRFVRDEYRPCFIDERGVEFHPPGNARHAFARPRAGHPPLCFLSDLRRLGVPYPRAFHYDCVKGNGNIKELFYGCHEPRKTCEGDPHLNVAPNDFVRV